MAQSIIGKLRDRAVAETQKNNVKKALFHYEQLATLRPKEGVWLKKSGDLYRSVNNLPAAIEFYSKACVLFTGRGFHKKATALCNLILRLDPQNAKAVKFLEEMTHEKEEGNKQLPGRNFRFR